jgi:hypothetical protein
MRSDEMALTRDFKETVQARASRDPAFRQALLREAVAAMLAGDLATGKAVLRDYINATIGFEELGRATGTPANSLMRMFGPRGNHRRAISSPCSATCKRPADFIWRCGRSRETRSAVRRAMEHIRKRAARQQVVDKIPSMTYCRTTAPARRAGWRIGLEVWREKTKRTREVDLNQ